jgi:hypothetical protein
MAAGWKPPEGSVKAVTPGLDPEIEAIVKDVEELQGTEAAAKIRARLSRQETSSPATPNPAANPPVATPAAPDATRAPAKPGPSVAEAQAQGAIQAIAQGIQAQHKEAAPGLLKEIAERVAKVDAERFEETGFGLRPEKWAEVFRREADAVLARQVEQSRRKAPSSLRSNPPSPSSKGGGSYLSELLSE